MQADIAETRRVPQMQGSARSTSSSLNREMTLNDALPSVLGNASQEKHSLQPRNSSSQRLSGTISVPRHVYAVFAEEDTNTLPSGNQDEPLIHLTEAGDQAGIDNDGKIRSLQHDIVPSMSKMTVTARSHVEFEETKNKISVYSPSSQGTPCHTLSDRWQMVPELNRAFSNSDALEGPNPDGKDGSPVSRCASNLAQRAGTFNELVSPCESPDSARVLEENLPSQLSLSKQLSIRTSSEKLRTSLGDIQLSRRASNMADRAGTFDELVEVSGKLTASSSLSTPAAFEGIAVKAEKECPLNAGDTPTKGIEADGTISRRYTNMIHAAGAFDELVDEDGDVLSSSESDPEVDGSSYAEQGISFSGMLTTADVKASEHQTRDNTKREFAWTSVKQVDPNSRRVRAEDCQSTAEWLFLSGILPSDLCRDLLENPADNPQAVTNKSSAMQMIDRTSEKAPVEFGDWGSTSLDRDKSHRSLGVVEAPVSAGLSMASSTALLSARKGNANLETDTSFLTGENSAFSSTLPSMLSIRTPRAVLQKFDQEDNEPLASVISTHEAFEKLATTRVPKSFNDGLTEDREKTKFNPKLTVDITEGPCQAASDVLTPQEWLGKISGKNEKPWAKVAASSPPDLAHHLNVPVKVIQMSPVDDGTLGKSTRLGAFRPEEESLI